ncbi:MAG: flagellar basal-body rod protein FlgG [Deferribacteraceae bacterium]|jgi:flagellar basal-body rod protein FlgG|nr:flagellar basal-body rod protein FlgG [Deferribacteraceae bacterium]
MVRSLYTAATGMNAQQKNIDNTSNNIANANNAGFKKGRVLFEDLLYQELKAAGSLTATGISHPTGVQEGMGVNVVAIEKIFTQGSYQYTDVPMDVAISGDGFFQVTLPDGTTAYTRAGSFKRDADGNVVTPSGYYLFPNINIPEAATELSISNDGIFSAYMPGEAEPTELGQIEIARFINPAGLRAVGENLFTETGASGAAQVAIPGEEGFGSLRQFFLEMSNVNIADEMVNMIVGQRAYEMNSKAIQTSDEMLQIANGLKR